MRYQFPRALFGLSGTPDTLLVRWATTTRLFDAFMRSASFIDGQVTLNLGDGGGLPGLSFCAHQPGFFLIPDAHYLGSSQYLRTRQELNAAPVKWANRRPLAFWRGSTTGQPADIALGWHGLPRIRLCEISKKRPDLIDAGVTSVHAHWGDIALQYIQSQQLLRPPVSRATFQQYKYQIDIDGYSSAWDALFMRLWTGSPVLKVTSERGWRQWYYRRMQPWVNFVPIAADMSDLIEKIEWLHDHDDVAERIGSAGRDLAISMTDEKEIERSASVVATAIRAASDGCLVEKVIPFCRVDEAEATVDDLGPGLAGAPVLAATTVTATLTSADCLTDLVLLADVSAISDTPMLLAVSAAGQSLAEMALEGRTTVYVSVPQALADAYDEIPFTFSLRPADNLSTSSGTLNALKVHRVALAAARRTQWDGYADANELLRDVCGNMRRDIAHHLRFDEVLAKTAANLGAPPRPLYTYCGTRVYADFESNCIRHGQVDRVAQNLFLFEHKGGAILCRSVGKDKFVRLMVKPVGRNCSADTWVPWSAGLVHTFEAAFSPEFGNERISLKAAGLYLCAELSGDITLSRSSWALWETFSLSPLEA